MMTKKWDKIGVGIVVGLIGGVIGFIIYGLYYSFSHNVEFTDFVNRVFLGNKILRAPILSLSILFNLLPFYILLNKKYYKGARGVMISIFIYAIAIVYYRFFS
jgi:hypothetical protein